MTRAGKAEEIRSTKLTKKRNTRPASYRRRREQQPWIEIFAICEFFHQSSREASEISSFVLTVCGGREERKLRNWEPQHTEKNYVSI